MSDTTLNKLQIQWYDILYIYIYIALQSPASQYSKLKLRTTTEYFLFKLVHREQQSAGYRAVPDLNQHICLKVSIVKDKVNHQSFSKSSSRVQ